MREDDLGGRERSLRAGARRSIREIRERLGEANCLQSLGRPRHPRGRSGGSARSLRTKPCSIFREIRERLGEANCLQSLGDLAMREADLDAARGAYDTSACRSSAKSASDSERPTASRAWASSALAENRAGTEAFIGVSGSSRRSTKRFGTAWESKACFGYLARVARQGSRRRSGAFCWLRLRLRLGAASAIASARRSPLRCRSEIWIEIEDFDPALGAMLVHRAIGIAMRDPRIAGQLSGHAERRDSATTAGRRGPPALEANPESFRAAGIEDARERFAATGLDLFAPPDPEPDRPALPPAEPRRPAAPHLHLDRSAEHQGAE